MNLDLEFYPAEILRKQAEEIKFPLADSTRRLVRDMFDTVRSANGIGLAAPQIGKSLRLIVVNLEHLDLPIFALLNPVIIDASRKKTKMEEGCLSIPGVFGIVERPEKIKFRAQDLKGGFIETEADGLLGRVIQHETDHINGVLIIDKIKKYTKGKDLIK